MKKHDTGKIILVISSLIALMCVSYFFYWRDIAKAGLYVSDEGYYIQIVRTYFYAIKYFKNIIFGNRNLGTLQEYLMIYGGPFFNVARQGYILLISVISSLFLRDYYFYHGLQWSAFFGTGCIFVTYFFVCRNFDAKAALVSALLLSLSSLHIAFARSVLTISASMFFLLLGIFFSFESFKKNRFLRICAFCFGIAFTCHYNIIWIFPLIFWPKFMIFCVIKINPSYV